MSCLCKLLFPVAGEAAQAHGLTEIPCPCLGIPSFPGSAYYFSAVLEMGECPFP